MVRTKGGSKSEYYDQLMDVNHKLIIVLSPMDLVHHRREGREGVNHQLIIVLSPPHLDTSI